MSSEVRATLLGDLLEITSSKRIHMADYVTSGIPFYRSKEVIERAKGNSISTELFISHEQFDLIKQKFGSPRDGDILLTSVGTLGVPYVVRGDGDFYFKDGNLTWMRNFSKEISPQFLYYWLTSPQIQQKLDEVSIGSTQKALTISALKALQLPLPTRATQDGIVEILGAISDRITLLRETNATLEAIAQALFKSWFVDFDPVRAKLEGRAPEGMDEATARLFPDSFEESELGLVPRGWRVGRVADLGDVICGKTPPTAQTENYGEDVPFITIPDMHNLLVVTSTTRSLSRIGADTQRKKYLPPGSICISCIATPGLVVRVTAAAQTNQQINSVVPLARWGKAFPLFLLRRIGVAVRAGGSGGSVFHNLSKSGFEELKVLLTTSELAQRFDEVIEPLVSKIVGNQIQAQTLATLRDTLLPRLISGQLRLPEAQAAAEEALA